jgi:DNA-binding CsgD family transcriptional regulator
MTLDGRHPARTSFATVGLIQLCAVRASFGRDRELKMLAHLLANVKGGQSGVLVVRGEPGVGKTTLLSHVLEEASDFDVARVVGVESEMELPFAGLHELCGPLLGRLDALPEPQREALSVAFGLTFGNSPDRFLVALATLGLLATAAEERPLVCLVDDAQWLDQASAQVFGFVGRRLWAERVGLVFAAAAQANPLDHLAGLPELRLEGLDHEAARALLESVVPGPLDTTVRDRIIEETGGNPLALLELSRGLTAAELAGGFAPPDTRQIPRRIEDEYQQRLAGLPVDAQRLVLLAAADPVGDARLVLRAAGILGLDTGVRDLIARAGLVEIRGSVRFRHPLVRSAAYGLAAADDRRAVHAALAAATDPRVDPDRRAWHRAQAAAGRDAQIAEELMSSAGRALQRGGVAAGAAFLERAAALTPDLEERTSRALEAAKAKYAAGDFEAVQALLVAAEEGPTDGARDAEVRRIRAQMAFALKRGRDAPPLLLSAARRLEPLDSDLARETYIEALIAAIYAGRLARTDEVALAAGASGLGAVGAESAEHDRLLLGGLARRLTDGYVAGAPTLREALRRYRSAPPELDWMSISYHLVAMDLWDDDAWFEMASGQAELARRSGTLSWLPFVLDYLAEFYIQSGDLAQAEAVLAEAERIDPGIRAGTLPYVPLMVAAWRGAKPVVAELSRVMLAGAEERGEGAALTYTEYAQAVLHNGKGEYAEATASAESAVAASELVISPWALYELVEGAARSDKQKVAEEAAGQLTAAAAASQSPWARGVAARSRALVSDGAEAEALFRQAIVLLGQTRMHAHLARAQLSYGEWLRRQNRRVDARAQLQMASNALASMGAHGFAERARRELQATGGKVRKREDSTRHQLTPQEEQIAQLARVGKTNPEIGAQLFIGTRTVEWHMAKVFTKLGINSRRELDDALKRRHP